MKELRGLSYGDKVGLLFEAHDVLRRVLDTFFSRHNTSPGEDLTHIHLQLRVLIEEVLSGKRFQALEKQYYCPYKSLYDADYSSSQDWMYRKRARVNAFHARIVEIHAKAGSPPCPAVVPHYILCRFLREWLRVSKGHTWSTRAKALGEVRRLVAETQHDIQKQRGGPRLRPRSASRVLRQKKTEMPSGGYKCADRIRIYGIHPEDGVNVVNVNKGETKISDRLLALLLRLVVELKKGEGGWIDRDILIEENIVPGLGHQIYTRLRKSLEPHLLKRNGRDFIENDGKGNYRISTPPGLVECDKKRLVRHPTKDIRDVAKKLPRCRMPTK